MESSHPLLGKVRSDMETSPTVRGMLEFELLFALDLHFGSGTVSSLSGSMVLLFPRIFCSVQVGVKIF